MNVLSYRPASSNRSFELYLMDVNPQFSYQIVANKLSVRYNTLHRKFSLQLEVNSLVFDKVIARHQIQNEKEYLRHMVEHLNNITLYLVNFFMLNQIG